MTWRWPDSMAPAAILLSIVLIVTPIHSRSVEKHPAMVVIATYAEDVPALRNTGLLTESLRTFGGRLSSVPVWVYVPDPVASEVLADSADLHRLEADSVILKTFTAPPEAGKYFYGFKPFAAAEAERAAAALPSLLVWMDDDTAILDEPAELILDSTHFFAYRPVMHNRSGSLYNAPPSDYWQRIYDLTGVDDRMQFPMISVADRQTIRPYFNCGLTVVRPERQIFAGWAANFLALCRDSVMVEMCRSDQVKSLFLHQTALVGAVLNRAGRDELRELEACYNYPVFFHKQYPAEKPFDDLSGVITLRTEVLLQNAGPDWATLLKGPREKIEWLKSHLGRLNR